MTGPAEPRARRDAEATRRRLIAAALELFTTVGFRATTTPMLAERAGIAEGTIYRHFSGKDALLNAAYRQVHERATAIVKEIEADRTLPVRDRLLGIARRMLEEAAREGAAMRMLLQTREERHLDERSRESGRQFRSALQQVMASGKSDGVVRAGLPCDPPEGAYYLFCDVSGFETDDLSFADLLVEQIGVAAVPGSSFYADGGSNRIRFTFSKRDETLAEACRRLERLNEI
jgi:AcrR family transcriptional regulator